MMGPLVENLKDEIGDRFPPTHTHTHTPGEKSTRVVSSTTKVTSRRSNQSEKTIDRSIDRCCILKNKTRKDRIRNWATEFPSLNKPASDPLTPETGDGYPTQTGLGSRKRKTAAQRFPAAPRHKSILCPAHLPGGGRPLRKSSSLVIK